MNDEPVLNPVQIRYSDDRSFIYVSINPREVLDSVLPSDQILEALLDTGYSSFEYQIDQGVLEELSRLPWNRLNRVIVRRIAWRVEFDLKVTLSPDQMQAFVSITPSFAQEVISRSRLLERLSQAGVRKGLLPEALEAILNSNEAAEVEIARGQEAVHGKDGWLEVLFEPLHLASVLEVPAGTPLLRHHAGQIGQDGYTVTGKILSARNGQALNLSLGSGCGYDPQHPEQIVALKPGVPVLGQQSLRMDSLVRLRADSLHETEFLHSLEIEGDLPAEIRLRTQGHLVIRGQVNTGYLSAGADLVIQGTVQGPVRLEANGAICLEQATQALLHCGGDLRVSQRLSHCRVYCQGHLLAAEAECAGGALYVLKSAVCAELGDQVGTATLLHLGPEAYFNNRHLMLQAEQSQFKQRLQASLKTLIQQRSQRSDANQHFGLKQGLLQAEQEALSRELQALEQQIRNPSAHYATVLGKLHAGVAFASGDRQYLAEQEATAVQLSPSAAGWQITALAAC